MTTLVPLDYRYENRVDVKVGSPPGNGEAALFRALEPFAAEWQLQHWIRWTVVARFVDIDSPAVQDQLRRSVEIAIANSRADGYEEPPAGQPTTTVATLDGLPVPELNALPATADYPIATQATLTQTTLTHASRTDGAELAVVATFTPAAGAAGEALRRGELGDAPDLSSDAGPATAIGNIATIDAGTALVTLTLVEPRKAPTDTPSTRLDQLVAALGPLA